ncbi:YecA family protein [Indiicoccus explosivorum]|uniref:YecA family protein n=1 Tax=Indiicoccus explosivorum TaxID=1917864 RepID=UPI0019D40815|nr:SEC-C metal-binding domain-containing protein [Indiicoccus explosivorum]
MTGRNDPCPCGSGQKYKKCCGKPKEIEELIDEELERVMQGAITESIGHREHEEISQRIDQWQNELEGLFDEDLIETLAFETYMYIEKQELWRRFLIRQLNKTERPQVKEVLLAWQRPFIVLGEVQNVADDRLLLKDEMTGKEFSIDAQGYRGTGGWLFGIVFQDPRRGDNDLQGTGGLVFIPENQRPLMEEIRAKLKDFDGELLALYKLFGDFEQAIEFSPFQEEVLEAVKRYMADHNLESETMMNIAQLFLLKEDVNARKPGAVAAGLIAGATEHGVFGDREVLQKEVGEYFGVASGTLAKYREMVWAFIYDRVQDSIDEQFVSEAEIGTDPLPTERGLWEMIMRVSRHPDASSDEVEQLLQSEKDKPFEPANDEERAQLLCYEAYEADTDDERFRLAREAEQLAPDLADVNLILADAEEEPTYQKLRFAKAQKAGLLSFNKEFDDPWMYVPNRPMLRSTFKYGAWKLANGDAEGAALELEFLLDEATHDHQGAVWLLVSAYLALGRTEDAFDLLPEDELYMNGLATMIRDGKSREDAIAGLIGLEPENDGLNKRLQELRNPGMFPRYLSIDTDGEELTYWLMYWPLQQLPSGE